MYTLYLKQIREIMAQSASIAKLNGVIEVRDARIKKLEAQLASAKVDGIREVVADVYFNYTPDDSRMW